MPGTDGDEEEAAAENVFPASAKTHCMASATAESICAASECRTWLLSSSIRVTVSGGTTKITLFIEF